LGTEALWVPAAIAALGAGATYYNTDQTAERQDRTAAQQIMDSGRRQQQADTVVDNLIRQQSASSPQDEIEQSTNDYIAQLQRGNVGREGAAPGVGGAAFQADQIASDAALSKYGTDLASLFGRVSAPALQRRNEGVLFNDASSQLGLIKRGLAGDEFINNLKLKAIARDPYLDAFASVAGGAAGSGTDWGNLGSFGGV
jgi:hypothetical protein